MDYSIFIPQKDKRDYQAQRLFFQPLPQVAL